MTRTLPGAPSSGPVTGTFPEKVTVAPGAAVDGDTARVVARAQRPYQGLFLRAGLGGDGGRPDRVRASARWTVAVASGILVA